MLELDEQGQGPKIKVVGVGGGGGNAVNTMIEASIQGVDFVAANTDCQVLETNLATIKVQIGKALTKGLGAGANPDIGCAAALEDASRLAEVLGGADMVFVTAGMGGGTGTGAAPVIARVARELGALTVGVVTKPFMFEGLQRKKKANSGIAELAKAVDALIVIPNDRLVALGRKDLTLRESFAMVDGVCAAAVRGISDLIMVPGLINVDFADVRTIMTGMGRALMGSGTGKGDRRAVEAAQAAITSPLLEDVSINGATGILVNITGGPDLTLFEVNEACSLIHEAADPDANIIFGSVIDANLQDEVRITVIATGFQSRAAAEISPATPVRSSGRKTSENQMSLPMQPAAQAAPSAPVRQPASQPVVPPAQVTMAIPAASSYPLPEVIAFTDAPTEVVESYPDMTITFTPPPVVIPVASAMAPSGAHSSMGHSAPVIRAAVPSPISSPSSSPSSPRRAASSVPVAMAAEHLGIEENEYDKPTYLRRALAAEHPMALRMPGEGK